MIPPSRDDTLGDMTWSNAYLPWLLATVFAVVGVGIATIVLLRTVVKRQMRKHILKALTEEVVPKCARCGCDLRGQNYPRCPECGTLRGFDVPMDDLPLTEEERRLIEEKCRGVRGESG